MAQDNPAISAAVERIMALINSRPRSPTAAELSEAISGALPLRLDHPQEESAIDRILARVDELENRIVPGHEAQLDVLFYAHRPPPVPTEIQFREEWAAIYGPVDQEAVDDHSDERVEVCGSRYWAASREFMKVADGTFRERGRGKPGDAGFVPNLTPDQIAFTQSQQRIAEAFEAKRVKWGDESGYTQEMAALDRALDEIQSSRKRIATIEPTSERDIARQAMAIAELSESELTPGTMRTFFRGVWGFVDN